MINIAKHNKGLRLLAVLFNCIDIFETESFIDIYTSVDIYPKYKDKIYLLYKAPIYDRCLLSKIEQHKNFIESKYIVIDSILYILFIFIILKDKQLYYDYIKSIGGSGVSQIEMFEVFVFWKKYIDKKFYSCYYCEKCENVLMTKGTK